MQTTACIVIFDIGKTNKKCLVFDSQYRVIHEESTQFEEITDDEGFPTEDIQLLENWLKNTFNRMSQQVNWEVKALHFSGYGASIVSIDASGKVVGFLKNYLKPVQQPLFDRFFSLYGPALEISRATCSPILGNLNSGYQVYEERQHKRWSAISDVLHFPNYLSYLFHGQPVSEMTSIGCHTMLWNFDTHQYHKWVASEELSPKLPAIQKGTKTYPSKSNPTIQVGLGLHDSSAALVPYLRQFTEKFILISTGTWCISMNPFNHLPLTQEELANDVLAYAQMDGKPVKSARLFAGNEHEQVVKQLVQHFKVGDKFYKEIGFNQQTAQQFEQKLNKEKQQHRTADFLKASDFLSKKLTSHTNVEEAYRDFMTDLVIQLLYSLHWVYNGDADYKILVDGGFSKNDIFMNCLAMAFPAVEVYGAEVAQASSLGAALAIHESWNAQAIPNDLIQLRRFKG